MRCDDAGNIILLFIYLCIIIVEFHGKYVKFLLFIKEY